jgi:phosphomannomutase
MAKDYEMLFATQSIRVYHDERGNEFVVERLNRGVGVGIKTYKDEYDQILFRTIKSIMLYVEEIEEKLKTALESNNAIAHFIFEEMYKYDDVNVDIQEILKEIMTNDKENPDQTEISILN